jgi:hypothetical protein
MARCVIEMNDELVEQLREKAGQLDMPVSGTIKLAIKTLLKISDRIAEGGKVVIQDKQGSETTLWIPQLDADSPVKPPQ